MKAIRKIGSENEWISQIDDDGVPYSGSLPKLFRDSISIDELKTVLNDYNGDDDFFNEFEVVTLEINVVNSDGTRNKLNY